MSSVEEDDKQMTMRKKEWVNRLAPILEELPIVLLQVMAEYMVMYPTRFYLYGGPEVERTPSKIRLLKEEIGSMRGCSRLYYPLASMEPECRFNPFHKTTTPHYACGIIHRDMWNSLPDRRTTDVFLMLDAMLDAPVYVDDECIRSNGNIIGKLRPGYQILPRITWNIESQ